jgi:hypothetical protein
MTNSDTTPPMDGQTCRHIQLIDAMILVAAIAVGLALAKVAFSGCYPRRPIPAGFRGFFAIECGHAAVFPCVASLTIAFVPLRLRRPRPPLAHVMRQPGIIACCMSLLQLATGGVAVATSIGGTSLSNFAFFLSPVIGLSIAGAWAVLRLNGWWRPEPGWVDAMGRALGVSWIIMPLVLFSAFLL